MPWSRPLRSKVRRISSLLRTSTQSPTFSFLSLCTIFILNTCFPKMRFDLPAHRAHSLSLGLLSARTYQQRSSKAFLEHFGHMPINFLFVRSRDCTDRAQYVPSFFSIGIQLEGPTSH